MTDRQSARIVGAAAINLFRYGVASLLVERGEAARFWRAVISSAGRFPGKREWWCGSPLPRVLLSDVFPEIDRVPVRVEMRHPITDGEVSNHELFTLAAIVSWQKPRVAFEIGTFLGSTTFHIAEACERTVVYTLDLPSVESLTTPISESEVPLARIAVGARSARRFHGTSCGGRIIQLYGDSLTFDFKPYHGLVDFAFIDAAHDELHVRSDTRSALEMLTPVGILVWHDYGRSGVTRVVEEVASNARKRGATGPCQIAGTSLAVFRLAEFER